MIEAGLLVNIHAHLHVRSFLVSSNQVVTCQIFHDL